MIAVTGLTVLGVIAWVVCTIVGVRRAPADAARREAVES